MRAPPPPNNADGQSTQGNPKSGATRRDQAHAEHRERRGEGKGPTKRGGKGRERQLGESSIRPYLVPQRVSYCINP